MTCSLPADFDYSAYSDSALTEALRIWTANTWPPSVECDNVLIGRKIAAIRAEIARRKETTHG